MSDPTARNPEDVISEPAKVQFETFIDQHRESFSSKGFQLGHGLVRVDADPHTGLFEQMAEPMRPVGVGPQREGDEEVVEAIPGEGLRLTDRGDGEPDGAGLHLAPCDRRRLVRLRVRAQHHPEVAGMRGHRVDIGEQPGAVDGHERRGQRLSGHAPEPRTCAGPEFTSEPQ